jgi:hypothetical protein
VRCEPEAAAHGANIDGGVVSSLGARPTKLAGFGGMPCKELQIFLNILFKIYVKETITAVDTEPVVKKQTKF